MKTKSNTAGQWNVACDSYGKVQHSRKYDCVYTVVKGEGGERLITVAARIENPADARLMSASKELLEALKAIASVNLSKSKSDLEFAGNTLEGMQAIAGAAIAKAEGGAQ